MARPGDPSITELAQGGKYFQAPILDQEQMARQDRVAQLGEDRLSNPTQGFDPIAANASRNFNTRIVPSLAERFTAQGGGQRSSAFQAAAGQAGSDLESQLGAQKAQYGLQQQNQALQQLQAGQQPQYSQAYYQPQDNQFGGQLASAGGTLANAFFKAPGGSALEKAKNVLGLASDTKQVADTVKSAVQGAAAVKPTVPTDTGSTGKSITELAAPAVSTATTGTTLANAGKVAATNPALAKVAADKAAAQAGGVAASTVAKVGLEAAIAPALAKFGAVAMPLAAIPLMGWIGYEIVKGLFEEFKNEPLF